MLYVRLGEHQKNTREEPLANPFWNTPWVILERMQHPFIYCANSIRYTLGLVDVCYFFRELVVTLPYNYPSFFYLFTPIPARWRAPRLPE